MRSLFIGLLGLCTSASAQTSEEVLVNMRRAYQEESAVYLKRNTVYRIVNTPTGTKAFMEVEEDQLVLKDEVGNAKEQEVHYSTMVPLENLEAYTMAMNGKGYKRIQAGSVDHRDQRGRQHFHDDQRVASFTMPALGSGSIAHVAYTLSFPDSRFASSHFFGDSYPTEESSLTVISDEGIEVDVKLFNVPDSLLISSVAKEKGRNVQRFAMRSIPAVRFESNAPSYYYYAPHAQLVVNVPGTVGAGDATSRLYKWYTEHVEEAFAEIPPPLRLLSDSITAGMNEPRDKAAQIFRWVQDKVQYVAIEDGMNGFIPANAMDVCRARYGDCKGMSNLLRTLLKAAGLDAHLAWVGTTQLPYTYADLPTSANSNHMIVALDMADTTLFLDPTSAHSAFGVPSGFIQGKEALIGVDKDRHRVQRIPVMPASYSTIHDSVRGHLSERTFKGQGVVRFTGYERHRITDALRDNTPEKRLQVMRQVLMKGSNAFLLDSIDVEGLDDREAPLTVSYLFRIPDLARQVGSKSYMPLTLSDPWRPLRVFDDRKLPLRLEYCSTERYTVTLELPPGSTCSGIPATFDSGTENFNIRIDHAQRPNEITSEATFTTNELMIASDMDAWRSLNTAYLKERGRTLVIETP